MNTDLFHTKEHYEKRNIKRVKQGKIQYQFHDAKQIGIHSRFLHLKMSFYAQHAAAAKISSR